MKKLLIAIALWATSAATWAAGYPLSVEAVQEEDGVWAVVAHNAGTSAVFINLQLRDRENVRIGGMTGGVQKALEPGAKETLMLAVPEKPEEKMKFSFETRWVFGRGSTRAEHTGIYRPPFQADLTFETINSAGPPHNSPRLKHAVDILMPEGTPVIAARTGYVMDVQGLSNDKAKGVWPYYDDPQAMGSYVRIIHDDGTWAEYMHLKDGSITVKPGEKVEAGTQIAESGATGAANRPHLQFNVVKAGQGFAEPVSIPIRMEMAGRGLVTVVAGETIGASFSVPPDAHQMQSDPLIVAAVKAAPGSSTTGVYSTRFGGGSSAEQLALVAVGMAMAIITALAIVLIRARKRSKDWKEALRSMDPRRWARKQKAEAAIAADTDEDETGPGDVNLRPEPGYLTAEWERKFMASVSLAMPIGYQAHAKVSLHRILARPVWVSSDPFALSVLRGESVDVAIVRARDDRIVAALEISRERKLIPGQETAADAKKKMLEDAGIKVIELPEDAGPSDIRNVLVQVAPNDIEGFGLPANPPPVRAATPGTHAAAA